VRPSCNPAKGIDMGICIIGMLIVPIPMFMFSGTFMFIV
jgi:hypothetical protein